MWSAWSWVQAPPQTKFFWPFFFFEILCNVADCHWCCLLYLNFRNIALQLAAIFENKSYWVAVKLLSQIPHLINLEQLLVLTEKTIWKFFLLLGYEPMTFIWIGCLQVAATSSQLPPLRRSSTRSSRPPRTSRASGTRTRATTTSGRGGTRFAISFWTQRQLSQVAGVRTPLSAFKWFFLHLGIKWYENWSQVWWNSVSGFP